ncbi:MAG TPA: SUMF1/EgtB/PvdO family nonheme iron enzyme [Rhodothermales bacterium]|nr:SUMF1/EgtB/PvdO family nonheme iron enzyme [Rhodothermales bacterium]
MAVGPVHATDLSIDNLHVIASRETSNTVQVVFDVSWQNAWHNRRNHDAAWVFLKLAPEGGRSHHVTLPAEGLHALVLPGSAAPPPQIDRTADGTGFFLYPAESYRGDVSWRISVQLDAATLGERFRPEHLAAFAIEMVYVPEGPFILGDPDPTALQFGAFYQSGSDGEPARLVEITSEAALEVGSAAGQLYYHEDDYVGDRQGPVPAAFPKGYEAFYVMKYELSQGQYVDFLNTLDDGATFERFAFGGRSYPQKRGTIHLDDGRYVAGSPHRPLNFSRWDDGLAFADWAAIRPMTELEFTKASRGPAPPVPGAFPWGTASRDHLARIIGPEDDLIMTNGWEEDQLSDETRAVFGASYYWVMDLAGSVWERVISIGQPDGRAFAGSHGDGELGERGRATNSDWPHTYDGKEGHGYRGGGFYDQGQVYHEFNPYSPVAYRRFGGWSGADPHRAYGFRAVRTAE